MLDRLLFWWLWVIVGNRLKSLFVLVVCMVLLLVYLVVDFCVSFFDFFNIFLNFIDYLK